MQPLRWMQQVLGLGDPGVPDTEQIALYVSGASVACAHARFLDGLQLTMRVDRVAQLTELRHVLDQQAQQMNLKRSAARHFCNLVMAPETYSMALLERPDVADEDLVDAVRWLIADQVEYPVEQAALDVFELPASASRDRPMVFVVSMQKEFLASVIEEVGATGLNVASVDVSELALRNLCWQCFPAPDQNVALLRLTANSGLINISRSDELYLSRRISGMPQQLSEHSWSEFQERLLLQVQRSIDYYESAMNQPHCDALLVACTDSWSQPVTEYLSEMLPIPVRVVSDVLGAELSLQLFNPEPEQLNFSQLTEQQLNALSAGLPAIGGALRGQIDKQLAEVA